MTPRERVQRARGRLATTVIGTAVLWGAAAAMGVIDLVAVIHTIAPLPTVIRLALGPIVVAAFVVVVGVVLWRGRAARSVERVALWVEEHEPRLQYALVTTVDERFSPAELPRELLETAAQADVDGLVGKAIRRALTRAVVASAAAAGVLVILQPRDILRAAGQQLVGRSGNQPAGPMPSRLTPLAARVTPPAYARLETKTLSEPSTIAALIGSTITLSGKGPAEGVTIALGQEVHDAVTARRGWEHRLTMPKEPAVLTLRDRAYRRLVVLEPIVDSAPKVILHSPAHDTTYQKPPTGRLELETVATDDIGLALGYFEFLITTGSEESFQTVATESPHVNLGNTRTATLRATIRLDTLKLTPGSVLHIRAVAFDANNVTGPGKGVSETRTLRVAEPIDSTSITAAPPLPIDSMWISQRLLNMKTDTLIRNKRRLTHQDFAHKSSGYSNAQEDIRRRVLAVVALLEDNGVGGSFATEESKLLREAAELMWSAREQLGIAQPDSAMPYMRKALKILDDVRMAYRYYLRGLMRPVVVNIERVRMTGKDSAAAVARKGRPVLNDPNAALAARLERAAALYRTSPSAALDSLTYIRVSALTAAPPVATAVGRAIDALRHGASIDSALVAARRLLEPRVRVMAGPPEWQ